jgi:ammonia channel protein AmtB
MMTDPGLALLDGGLVRTKNVVSTSDRELHLQGGRDGGVGGRGIWPGVGGNGILSVICVSRGSTNAGGAPRADYAPTIPQQTVIVYQPMSAIITSALIPGVFGERMKKRHNLVRATEVSDPDVALDGEGGTFSSHRHQGELA